ncbi:MAG: glycoside hydrolase family 97 protein [Bacteroidales bacterium]|nr:glycoside hydrolase family 97 protein [Bacteroidales bacterium]
MKNILFSLLLILCVPICVYGQKSYRLDSPDGNIRMQVMLSDKIYYDIACNGETLLEQGVLQMTVDGKVLGDHPQTTGQVTDTVNERLTPVVPFKFSDITNHYNRLLLKFKGNYMVEFRAFNDGVAYRFITNKKGEVEVADELFQVSLPQDYLLHVQQSSRFKTAYEEAYSHLKADEWNKSADKYTLLPVLIEAKNNYKILISESGLTDYPAMFLTCKGGKDKLTSVFPKNPIEFGEDGDRSLKLVKEADYIAKTKGKRNFPWRYFVITSEDGKLIENTMTARLAEPNKIADPSWIKPGVTTWEWWNGATPYGPDVNFVAGCNTDTYKYFIDFAAKFGVEYILLDEGWAQSTLNPYIPNKDLDLKEVIRYGKEKNVGVILWLTWLAVENNFDLFQTFEEWGIKGVKIDFMDRSDQWMVNYYERVAAEAARHKLFVDFHGSFKPAGLEYKYPNVLSYEGVRGMEQMGGCYPDNTLFLPYLRNAVGPMDYTPGAMLNYQPDTYRADRPNSGSIGTRAYQMALFVLFDTGLQMMADNPTLYYQNEDCARFMADIPVTTDETVALAAKAGEYAIVAKRKGCKWYIGGITNNKEKEREWELSLDFLESGKTYRMTSYEDGSNAGRQAMHYMKKVTNVKKGQTIKVKMVRNGGFAAIIE